MQCIVLELDWPSEVRDVCPIPGLVRAKRNLFCQFSHKCGTPVVRSTIIYYASPEHEAKCQLGTPTSLLQRVSTKANNLKRTIVLLGLKSLSLDLDPG